jgi:hypothetical protein
LGGSDGWHTIFLPAVLLEGSFEVRPCAAALRGALSLAPTILGYKKNLIMLAIAAEKVVFIFPFGPVSECDFVPMWPLFGIVCMCGMRAGAVNVTKNTLSTILAASFLQLQPLD